MKAFANDFYLWLIAQLVTKKLIVHGKTYIILYISIERFSLRFATFFKPVMVFY